MNRRQAEEYLRCKNDVRYFAEKYITIETIDGPIKLESLTDIQKEILNNYQNKRFSFVSSPRQRGKTTISAILLLHSCIFNSDFNHVVCGMNVDMTNHILRLISNMNSYLPNFFHSNLLTDNILELEFSTGSKVFSCGNSLLNKRGTTIDILYIDESDYINKVNEILSVFLPTAANANGKSKMFSSSTSRLQNEFEKFNRSAK